MNKKHKLAGKITFLSLAFATAFLASGYKVILAEDNTFVNLNFMVTSNCGGALGSAIVNIDRDFGNTFPRTTDGSGFANFGVYNNANIGWSVSLSGYSSDSGTVNSGNGTTVHPVLNKNGGCAPAYTSPYSSPYATPYPSPYATPYATPYSTPYATPYPTPYAYPTPAVVYSYPTPYAYPTPYPTPYTYPTPYPTPAAPIITNTNTNTNTINIPAQTYQTPYTSPYATPYQSPYATPYATPYAYPTPYNSYTTPYQSPYVTPYLTPYQTPYQTPFTTTVVRPALTSRLVVNSSIDRNQPIIPALDNTRPHPGDEINYTVNYQNVGTGSITNLVMRIDLPNEVQYLYSSPSNPNISGNTLIFNLGTLRANARGTVTARVRVLQNIPNGVNLNFPATLTYVDASGTPQTAQANVSAQVVSDQTNQNTGNTVNLGANVLGAGFLFNNIFGWLILIILVLLLVLLVRYLFNQPARSAPVVYHDDIHGNGFHA